MYSPNACGVASLEPRPVPSPNGSLRAHCSPSLSWAARSSSSVAGAITWLAPGCRIAWSSSASPIAPVS